MQIAYGPPGHRGVSSLVAVGDAEYESTSDQMLRSGTWVAGAVAALGLASGSRTLRTLGIGGLLAIVGVRAAARRRLRTALPVVS